MTSTTDIIIKGNEEKSLLEKIIKIVPAAIAVFDTELRYLMVSDRWYSETDVSDSNIIGKYHYDVVKDIPQKWKEKHQECLKGKRLKCEEDVFERKDGSIEWVRWEIVPWYEDAYKIGGMLMLIQHITTQKIAEKNLKNLIKKIQKSNEALELFTSIASHDLKEPLRTISYYADFLIEDYGHLLDHSGKEKLHALKALALKEKKLIDALFHYSCIANIDKNKTIINLNSLLENIIESLNYIITEKNSTIHITPNFPEVFGNATQIREVFYNLISNALKYNESSKKLVKVGYISSTEEKEGYVFYVKDNGIGIDPQYHQNIFGLFNRLDKSREEIEGTGIGLTIVKKVLDKVGGRIWVSSQQGKGSTFYFTLESDQ